MEAEPLKKGHRGKKMALLTRVLRVQRSPEGVPGAPILDSVSLKTGKCPDHALSWCYTMETAVEPAS